MAKKKFSKYFLYASGEIALVVAGILIALQINTWNQDRLDHMRSDEYHQRLMEDLDFMIETSARDAIRAEQVSVNIKASVRILQRGELFGADQDSLDYALRNFFQFVRISDQIPTYEEMKSTGQLGLIYSEEIREEINGYLAFLQAVRKMYDQMSTQVVNTEIIDKYVTVTTYNRPNSIKYDFDKMSEDQLLINILSRFGLHWHTKMWFSEALSKESTKLRDLIQEELSK